MAFESPDAVLLGPDGTELAVSPSQQISGSTAGIFLAASSSQGAVFLKASPSGVLEVSGAFSANVVLPVTQSTLEVGGAQTTLSSAIASKTAFEILPENTSRKFAFLYVEGNRSWYVGLGSAPTTNLFTIKLDTESYFEIPERYTGTVSVLASGNGNGTLMITETLV